MSMYLPNSDLRPTGNEPAEFIDLPAMSDDAARTEPRVDRSNAAHAGLTIEIRIEVTRLTQDYISDLVQKYKGDREDVRSIIRDLHHRSNSARHDGDR
jgi:hypothetical protein